MSFSFSIYTRSSCIFGGFSSDGYWRAARFFGFPALFFWISSWLPFFEFIQDPVVSVVAFPVTDIGQPPQYGHSPTKKWGRPEFLQQKPFLIKENIQNLCITYSQKTIYWPLILAFIRVTFRVKVPTKFWLIITRSRTICNSKNSNYPRPLPHPPPLTVTRSPSDVTCLPSPAGRNNWLLHYLVVLVPTNKQDRRCKNGLSF